MDPTAELELTDPEALRLPKTAAPLDINLSCTDRIIAVGDPHGCFDELAELLDRVAPVPGKDLVVILGDLVDRGPKSGAVVAYVKWMCENCPDFFCVLGNHDEKLVRHRRHEVARRLDPSYRNPMRVHPDRVEEYDQISDAEALWLSKRPAVIYSVNPGRTRVFTHAGLIQPGGDRSWEYAMAQPADGLIRNRYLRPARPRGATGQQVVDLGWEPAPHVRGPGGESVGPPGSISWDEIWTGPRVVYGHAVHDLETPRVHNDCYGIDTGCCFGGRLTAYIEEGNGSVHFEQVEARQTYFDRSGRGETE